MRRRHPMWQVERDRVPRGVWSWRSSLLVTVVVLGLQLVPQLLEPGLRTAEGVTAVAGLALYPAIFLSAVVAYLHWRLTTSQAAAWLTTALALVATHGLAVSGIVMSTAQSVDAEAGWFLASDLLVFVALLLATYLSERVAIRRDPAAVGVGLGAGLVAVHLVVVLGPHPGTRLLPGVLIAGTATLLLIGAFAGYRIARLPGLPQWARTRLALAVVALVIWRAIAMPPPAGSTTWSAAEVVAGTVAATLMTCTTLALLRHAIRNDRAALLLLNDRLSDVESEARSDRELLHEVKSTVAGIASASSLIREGDLLPGTTRHLLQEMLDVETARLQRLVHEGVRPPVEALELDDVVRPVVVARRALAQDVYWTPSGLRVRGRADDIAEVLTVLLDNAAAHAPGSHVEVEARADGRDRVELVVRDDGPGVPPPLRAAIFDFAGKGPGSHGQGMGLHIARRLARGSGHDLRLADESGRGATFVLTLDSAGRADDEGVAPEHGSRGEGRDAETGRRSQ